MAGRTLVSSPASSRSTGGADSEAGGRDLGIPAIGRTPWSTHFCQFYRSGEDLLDILIPFFQCGLQNNEACIWVFSDPLDADQIIEALRASLEGFDHQLRDGQIEIIPYTEWFMRDGVFDQDRVLTDLVTKLRNAQAHGYDGLRVSGNAGWVQRNHWRDFTDYEHTVNKMIKNRPIIALCTYSLDQCGASEIVDVVMHHQFALIKRDNEWVLIEPSERKMATEAVDQMNRLLRQRTSELQAALEDLRGFSYSVSHDLRAPLCAITSFGEALAEHTEEQLDDTARYMLQRIRSNAARMEQLITDVLAFSLAQRTEPMSSRLDMEALVHQTYEQLAADVGSRDVELNVGTLPPVYGDSAMISQVLANLLGNALKFTRNQPTARIEVGATTSGADTVFHVRDNGAGFDMTYVDKLFGVFQRLHGRDEFEGTGIGLAIVKQIITRHGGRVWAESVPGHGATFYFTLPTGPARPDTPTVPILADRDAPTPAPAPLASTATG